MDLFHINKITRKMAWEKAKGALNAYLETFLDYNEKKEAAFKVKEFIDKIEGR
jgi:hypothetical protein